MFYRFFVVEKIHKVSKRNPEEDEMYRSIMSFGTLSSILPNDKKSSSYIEFYEKLKSHVPSVIGNPHFWLQYAMAVMSDNNLSDAERVLEHAYSKANNNPDYDTSYIDNQFARLNLKKALFENDQSLSISFFLKAHAILKKAQNDIFKFRQAGLYLPYYKDRYKNLSKGNRVKLEHAIKEIEQHYIEFLDQEYPFGDIPFFHTENITSFRDVITEIASKRNA